MSEALKPGMTFDFSYIVPEERTVPHLYPDIEEGATVPAGTRIGFGDDSATVHRTERGVAVFPGGSLRPRPRKMAYRLRDHQTPRPEAG